ncbi:hypothetical protein CsSME_00009403 [Camellia sinensis var. sinensis]
MADYAPHDGDPPRIEGELGHIPLPTVRHFPEFARRAPIDLLLREPEFHLSHDAFEIVDEAGFGLFCAGLSRLMVSRTLLGALVERWHDTTNSFHFSATGDMTMTPYDFAMLTGLEVGGQPIPYDSDIGEWEAAWTYLLGAHPPIYRLSGLLWVYAYFPALAPELEVETPLEVPYSHRYDGWYHMAALGGNAGVCSISFCRSSGCLPIPDPARGTRVRAPTGRTANNASSSRARTVGVPSTSRARAPRGETRGMPSTRRCVGWPDPPTELTSWRISRVLYQILLEPPLPDHRYVRTPGSPPPSVEYVEGLLQVMASFEGIILRREMMLTSHRIPSSEEEEPASPQSESFEGGGDGTGSGSEGGDDAVEGSEEGSGGDSGSGSSLDSDGGADGDDAESAQPRKMMKRASQS